MKRLLGVAVSVFLSIVLQRAQALFAQSATTQSVTDTSNADDPTAWWADLEGSQPLASRALLKFSANPAAAIRVFKEKLLPLKLSAEEAEPLLVALGADDEQIWRPAFDDLTYRDPRLAFSLKELLESVTEPLARERLVALFNDYPPQMFADQTVDLVPVQGGFNFLFNDHSTTWAEDQVARINIGSPPGKKSWSRAVRAIVLLQFLRTPEALDILTEMAGGHPDAQPTRVANEALAAIKANGALPPLEDCWADLGKPEPAISRSLLALRARPAAAVDLFKSKLKPLTLTRERADELIHNLNSDDEKIWKPAFDELSYFDPRLAYGLKEMMDHIDDSHARSRLISLLDDRPADLYLGKHVGLRFFGDGQANFFTEHAAWSAEADLSKLNQYEFNAKQSWTRAICAIDLLEQIATPEAAQILREMASGHPDAQPTRVAREALQRLQSGR